MDALSDVLRVMRLKGGVYLHGEFSAPWCLSTKVAPETCMPFFGETAHVIPYHFVVEGRLRVRVTGLADMELGPGDTVMFPRNDMHLLGSDIDRQPLDSLDVVERPAAGDGLLRIALGTGGERTRIICGFLGAEEVAGNPILAALPPALRLDGRGGSAGEWIRTTFQHAAEQIAAGRLGSEVIMGKLSELLFAEAIQRYVESLPDGQAGWLAALKDRYVSRALALLHARRAEAWTVDGLAKEVGLSRSALADRFVAALGVPPMQYLASWRIHVAAHELIHSQKSILQVAQEVGYESEASFTRAFRRVMAAPPAAWRRARLKAPGSPAAAQRRSATSRMASPSA